MENKAPQILSSRLKIRWVSAIKKGLVFILLYMAVAILLVPTKLKPGIAYYQLTPQGKTDTPSLVDFGSSRNGFSEGIHLVKPTTSCMSRQESSSYQKPSPHKPSTYLISKLEDYEDLHHHCRSYYNQIITRPALVKPTDHNIVRNESNNPYEFCKYMVWTPFNGLGNRMMSLVSSFLYAFLTGRVLLVDFGPDMIDLFCEPFPHSSWLLSEDFPLKRDEDGEFQDLVTFQNIMVKILKQNDRNDVMKSSLPSSVYLNLEHDDGSHAKYFHCDDSHLMLAKIPVIVVRSDLYFAPSLFMTPMFMEELSRMFPQKETVFHHLGRYIFHPSDRAWGLITRLHHAYLATADERIGLQIRVFKPKYAPRQLVRDQIVNCTQSFNILPKLGTMTEPVKANASSENLNKTYTTKAVLVVSLSHEYAEDLRELYKEERNTKIHQPSREGHQKFNNGEHNLKAWVEMYLLSLSDKLVTSGQSTFGYVAQGLGGLKPWVLRKRGRMQAHSPCERAQSADPCFHSPPKYDCKVNKDTDNVSVLFPNFIRICEDRARGVKLSDVPG